MLLLHLPLWHSIAMEFNLKVMVVDDEPLVRGLLSEVLASLGYEVRSASSAAEARTVAKGFDPDVAILDIDLGPGPNGFDLELGLRHTNPQMAIVFLSNIPSSKMVGVSPKSFPKKAAYLIKSNMGDSAALAEAINRASRGDGGSMRDDLEARHELSSLSRSQFEVVELVARGMTNEEIAQVRGTSVRAVRMIVARAYRAMGIDSPRGAGRVKAALNFLKVAGIPK
jgi:DNA-binding NarL/FixJ family response regulator